MGRASSPGLTAQDFHHHHQPYVNPLDVFPAKSRLAGRSQNYRSPIRNQATARSSSRFPPDPHTFACCEDDEDDGSFLSSNALDCCVSFDHGDDSLVSFDQPSPGCCDEPHHNSPTPMDCDDCVDDCDDCVEEHVKAIQRPCHFVDGCDECDNEKTTQCPDGPACQETCDECDFSCFDCVDWTEFEKDKNLGLSFSVPLLDTNDFTQSDLGLEEPSMLGVQPFDTLMGPSNTVVPPVDVPMHHQCFANTAPYWDTIAQEQLCSGNPGLSQQLPLPPFSLNFGCHPAVAHQQLLPHPQPHSAACDDAHFTAGSPHPSNRLATTDPLTDTQDLLSAVTAPATSRACQWLMPCGTVCGASFATGTDLKKHLKAVHLAKGVTKCQWQGCDAADFASEAALTGHISKKHLAAMLAHVSATSSATATPQHKHHGVKHTHARDGGPPFKCTFPNCHKSFTYKHIRDEHVATHHGGNKMYCPVCHAYLNGEGSNFKRHMALHRPKHQHMLCKFHDVGCKRRFPRLDNLRRHEACCKFGKKAKAEGGLVVGEHAGPHHHHHHHARA
ncbi:hypothetical protein A1O7_09642 [Cladophialophora yegresii CBS 114405]|uniref:C2H2-type domain-containing protein n=1 Tax=Cladophialophora yegresii CBS 114405 TaxID=1182544 RepID=W9W6X9_9EURO|nr:uncharacterized protein A1O7_09642 [Cladophialophora yegresii CBS 114405]EXJ54304.1 hypothetical protein A1O7_09642 [Cladophialophora yegresii CBS 114405]